MDTKMVKVAQVPGRVNQVVIDAAGTAADALEAAGFTFPVRGKGYKIGTMSVEDPSLFFIEEGATLIVVDAPIEKEKVLFFRPQGGLATVLACKGEVISSIVDMANDDGHAMPDLDDIFGHDLTGLFIWEGDVIDLDDESEDLDLDSHVTFEINGFEIAIARVVVRGPTIQEQQLFLAGQPLPGFNYL